MNNRGFRFLLFLFFLYIVIGLAVTVQLFLEKDSLPLDIFFGWPLVPMYYMALFGGPMIVTYIYFVKFQNIWVHAGLAVVNYIYMFTVLYFISYAVDPPTIPEIVDNLQVTAKYGTMTAVSIMLTYFLTRFAERFNNRRRNRTDISAFD
jgi:hypothetical protein